MRKNNRLTKLGRDKVNDELARIQLYVSGGICIGSIACGYWIFPYARRRQLANLEKYSLNSRKLFEPQCFHRVHVGRSHARIDSEQDIDQGAT